MNKSNKTLPVIVACILSIVIGQVILWIVNCTGIDIIANILEVLVAIFNFIFVVYIFKEDQDFREEERKLNKEQKEKEYSLYWYQTFILPDSIKYIKEFKEELCKLVDDNLKIENSVDSNKYAKYTKLHIKCKNNVTEILKIISPKTEQLIRTCFSNFQDEFSKLVYETGTVEDMKQAIIENETRLLEILYKYEIF